jgi:WD40 repeat protein
MMKSVVINLGSGDLYNGFPRVTAQLWSVSNHCPQQFIGSLPAAPSLVKLHKDWQIMYQNICERQYLRSTGIDDDELEIEEGGITNVSCISFSEVCQTLHESINHWLKSIEFLNIDLQLRSQLQPTEEIRVIFESSDPMLRCLPWHRWDFFKDYPFSEMALSSPEYKFLQQKTTELPRKKVRILAILGNSKGINLETEISYLNDLEDAEVDFLVNPSRQEFNTYLWQQPGWDILFFAGHSQTEGEIGRIYINEHQTNNSLTIEQLQEALKAAIDNGLQLAIFNSCDSLGLGLSLEKLNIPTTIVMREPVPNLVAEEFFQHFMAAFALERLPLYLAVQQARRKLQGLEDEFPGASWLPVICQNPAVEPPTWLKLGGIPPCPYRGLFAFREEDAHLFFGREEFTRKLVTAVKKKPLVAVVGASGSGKTSVIHAGLIPKLRQDTNVQSQIISFRPGKNPFEALALALTPWKAAKNETNCRLVEMELEINLRHQKTALCQVIETILHPQTASPLNRLVLIVDQFEELYTLCPEEDRLAFLNALLTAVKFAPAFTLAITLRADFYGYALSYRPFSDALQGSVLNLGPMSHEELRSAIEQPANKMQVQLEKGLTNELISEMEGQTGHLPLLEFALMQLWSKQKHGWLTHKGYEEIGGVEEALANHAEAVYAQLSEADRERAQQVFMQLVRLGEDTEATRRLATRDEVQEENWDLVTHLASHRLVVTNRNEFTNKETVEIVHEALIRSWGRLEYWLQADSDFRHWQEQLRATIRRWEKSDRDEGALLRGKPLSDAEYWLTQRFNELSPSEKRFINLSSELREREINKQKRRRQLTIFGLSSGLVLALGLAGVAWWQSQKSARSEVEALSKSSAGLFVSGNRMEALVEAIKAGQRLKKLDFVSPETEMQVKLMLQLAVYKLREYNRLSEHSDSVYSISVSPDGKTFASASRDRSIKLWRWDGKLLNTLTGHKGAVNSVSFSPDSQIIATASDDRTIKLWSLDGKLLNTLTGHKGAVNSVSFSPDSQIIATASDDTTIKLWSRDGKLLQTISAHNSAINCVTISPDGQIISSASHDKTIKLWSWDGRLLNTLVQHTADVSSVAFSPDSQIIASGSQDRSIKLWNRDGQLLNTLVQHTAGVSSVAFSPDGQTIASTGEDESVRIWNRKGKRIENFWGHDGKVFSVFFSADGKKIVSGGEDKTVRLWSVDDQKRHSLNGHKRSITSLTISPDGKTFASGSVDNTIKLWSQDGELLKTLTGHNGVITSLTISPDGKILAAGSADKTVKLWSQDGKLLKTFTGHNGVVTSLSFSPDGKTLASGSADKTVKLWSRDGQFLKTLTGHSSVVTSVSFSPNGKTLASGSADKTVKLWNLDNQQPKTLGQHQMTVRSLSFSPDSKTLVSGSDDATIKLWSLDSQVFKTLSGHIGPVTSITFSSDGKLIASASKDMYIKLWDLNGQERLSLRWYSEDINSVIFSPVGNILVGATGNTPIIWDLNVDNLLMRGCNWLSNYLKNSSSLQDIRHKCD